MSSRNSTIDDVAKEAGVARVTVSRVLNNVQNVRPQTREKVLRAVEVLGYSVNQQARALASGSSQQIMLIHANNPDLEPNSYYDAGLELGALRACSSLGLDLVTRAVDPHDENRTQRLSSIIERDRPAGLILSPPLSDDVEFICAAQREGVAVVAVSAGEEARAIVSAVGIDERSGGHAIGRHLTSLGHRSIGFIKGPAEHRAASARFDGFLDALRGAGIEEAWTADGDFTFKSGVEGAEQLLRERPSVTALACANDDMAAGAMLALHRAGLDIPSAISVTGFDDTPMSEIIWPPLTTIRQPIKGFTERAVAMLVDTQSNGDLRFEALPHELIIRESTGAPAQHRRA